MAHITPQHLRTRIREVLEDGAGLVRTVTQGRIDGDYWVGSDDYAARARTLVRPRFDIPAYGITPHFPTQYELCNTKIYVVEPVFECDYALPEAVLDDADRDAIRAQAEQDADIFRQALGWVGNVAQTSGGDPTGLINGYLAFVRFEIVLEAWEAGAQRLITRHFYRGYLKTDAATS